MRCLAAIALVLACCLTASCGDDSPTASGANSRLEAYVHWQDTGLPDKRLEVVELGLEKRTDAEGRAAFTIPPGTYTLRAYEINAGGPVLTYVDYPVTTAAGDTTRVDVVDCLPCV